MGATNYRNGNWFTIGVTRVLPEYASSLADGAQGGDQERHQFLRIGGAFMRPLPDGGLHLDTARSERSGTIQVQDGGELAYVGFPPGACG